MIDRCHSRQHPHCLLNQMLGGSDVAPSICTKCQLHLGDFDLVAANVGRQLQHSVADCEFERESALDEAILRAKGLIDRTDRSERGDRSHATSFQFDTINGDADWTKPNEPFALDDGVAGYKILHRIGSGGMGEVYLAEQRQPVQRQVALKLIKAGMDSQQVLARFAAEQQALAIMDHPGIARVFDGGMTDRGHPYFAMEYVDGIPLTEYCDQHQLSISDRLNLFVQVCDAVGHAHQKGIIHRDLKPSNILVRHQSSPSDRESSAVAAGNSLASSTESGPEASAFGSRVQQRGSKPICKVIDFGLAKALHFQLTDETTLTRHFAAMGTVRYMSPEQADGKAGGADTRSDIYSLGVLLFELLTGSTPLTKEMTDRQSSFELLQRIRSGDPIRPSVRIRDQRDVDPLVAANRRSDLSVLSRELRRDLDWIVMKAIETDRDRRYETVAAFADDIERYLAAEPVTARPPSSRYRLQKFASKHRVGVGMATLFATLLVATSAISSSLYLTANSQRARAAQSERSATTALEIAKAAEQTAIQEQQRATASERVALAQSKSSDEMIDFLGDVMAPARPDFLMALGDSEIDTRSRAQRVREELADAPLVQARLMNLVGSTYLGIGRVREAGELLKDALEIRQRLLPGDDPAVAESLHNVGDLHFFQGRKDTGREMAERAVEIRTRIYGPDDPRTLTSRMLVLMTQLEGPHMNDSQLRFSVVRQHREQWEDILERRSKSVSNDHPDLAKLHLMVASLSAFLNEKIKAFQHAAIAMRIFDQQEKQSHIGELLNLFMRAQAAEASGDGSSRNEALRRILEIGPEIFGGNAFHPVLLYLQSNLQFNETDSQESESLARAAIEGCREVYGDEPRTATALHALGSLLTRRGDPDQIAEGIGLLEEAIEIQTECLGPNHWETGLSHATLGIRLSWKAGPYTEQASFHLRQALAIFRAGGFVDYSYLDKVTSYALFNLAERTDRIDRDLQPVVDNLDARLKVHPGSWDTLFHRGAAHRTQNEFDQAAACQWSSLRIVSTWPSTELSDPCCWIRIAMWASLGDNRGRRDEIRTDLIRRFADDAVEERALPMAVAVLLGPCNTTMLEQIGRWIESSEGQDDPEFQLAARALYEYRAGHYQSALKLVGQAVDQETETDRSQILMRLIESLCYDRLDQPDAAQQAIAAITPAVIDKAKTGVTAKQIQDVNCRKPSFETMRDYLADQLDWVACQVLWREVMLIGDLRRLDPTTALRVNSTGDELSLADDSVTLREAITAANFFGERPAAVDSPASEITFDSGVFATPQTIRVHQPLPTIVSDLSISGPAAKLLTIDAGCGTDQKPGNGDGWRIFLLDDGDPTSQIHVRIGGLTITGGDHPSTGGAICNSESLTLTDVAVTASSAVYGGGLANSGELMASGCTFSGNSSFGRGGGGAINSSGVANFINCTISGNRSSGHGGGIINYGPPQKSAHMTLTNCTLVGNSAGGNFVGIQSFANGDSILTLHNTIVMGVVGGNRTVRGSHNLFGDPVLISGTNELSDSLTGVAPRLGPLADNGGATATHALLPGSPAIDAGDPTAVAGESNVPLFDQRGTPRIADDPDAEGTGIDIGAVEGVTP